MAPHARLLWKSLVSIYFSLPRWVESESRGGPAGRCLVLSALMCEVLGTWRHFMGLPFGGWPEGKLIGRLES